MNSTSTLKSEINLAYPDAGIQFLIGIKPDHQEKGSETKGMATLSISVKDTSGERSLAFTQECSPVLGDFIGGFVRWLSTLGITAGHNGEEITGIFRADYNVFKLIQASAAICDMINQRFSLYPDNILA